MPDQTDGAANIFNLLSSVATPFAQRLAYGSATGGGQAAANETARYNNINGSGALSNQQARSASMSFDDFLYGSPINRQATAVATAPVGQDKTKMILLAALAAVALWVVLKKL